MPTGKRLWFIIAAMLLGVLLQSTIVAMQAPRLRVDVIMAIAAAFGLVAGPFTGGVAGLIGGLLADMLTGRFVGLGMLTHAVVGLLSGLLGRRLFSENLLVSFGVGSVLGWVEQILYLVGARAFGVIIPLRFAFPSLWYNGLLAALCFTLVHRVNEYLAESE